MSIFFYSSKDDEIIRKTDDNQGVRTMLISARTSGLHRGVTVLSQKTNIKKDSIRDDVFT